MANTECALLELAAELRNEIYELAFTSNSTEEIDLFDTTKRLSNALLRTCRQIHYEAKPIYRKACDQFWTKGHFFIDLPEKADLRDKLEEIGDRELSKVAHLRAHFRETTFVSGKVDMVSHDQFEMLGNRGSWYRRIDDWFVVYHRLILFGDSDPRWGKYASEHIQVDSKEEVLRLASERDERPQSGSSARAVVLLRTQLIAIAGWW